MILKIRYRPYNSGGPGGQHNNRTLNAIEASVEVPGLGRFKATSSSLKSQHQNKARARKILASKVLAAVKVASKDERRETAGFGPNGRVRTYHEPDNRVVDESGFRVTYRETVGRGEVGKLIEERARRMGL